MTDDTTNKSRLSLLQIGCLSLVGLASLVIVGLVIWAKIDAKRGFTAERIESLIKEEIPANADRQAVESWFQSHGIHPFYEDNNHDNETSFKPHAERAKLNVGDLAGAVVGNVDGDMANVGFMADGQIRVHIFFDKDGKVAGHFVYPVIYSL